MPLTLAMLREIVDKMKAAQGKPPEYVRVPEEVFEMLRIDAHCMIGPWKEPNKKQ